ncbi:dihydrolipoyl dehydrogenase [Mycobacterium intermedium]|uniref:Dihydrolipoyl dehydrogenase n=1 Tax=Mycobacterium intermedium TaxID=28445 RepID=A0A1E3S659_MYCIE|nr:dihydrolipoyl dehydrogenase [Mycobacterium intermedium]MCV6966464.1 dihydrolipoyl dehydrogenase [Mycobacterium intermedium]ODQ97580.1 dihydrolipoyl dehydrogenase [Mycobacterium intermedium]OPE49682.1 dihydrolipoyl dehydrogenase [Mycobacterium intermedium]ORB00695.1 dihydrolipoyl dehydrogenase [Mycobacterium intermedium]
MTAPSDNHYDLVVLGAGSGGYVAAIRAAQLGMRVGLVEERYWGGVCLNTGCVPSKALLRNAEIASIITHQSATFGISGDVSLDYSRAVSRSREVAGARVRGVHFLMRKNNITEIDGHGYFASPHRLAVDLSEGGKRFLTFDHAVIATGARVRMLPGVRLSDNVVAYEQQILRADLPESIVIIGGGGIGMEFAYILHSYGVRVEILEFADRILPNEDADVSRELERQYRRRGIAIHTSTRVDKVIDHGEHVVVNYTSADGKSTAAQAARAFICIGFRPNVEGIGLDAAGVLLNGSGAIEIDEYMRTSAPHIYAVGDVTAKVQLAHVASAQGIIAAETMTGSPTMPLDYRMMPRVTFCQPQVASFGYTEAQARAAGHTVRVAKFPMQASAKAHGLGERAGFIKVIADASHGELLGAHLVGAEVSELLPELTAAQLWDLTATELARNVHTHPTLGEGLQECFHALAGHAINL